jgi:C1A family cysteine protease
MPGHKAAIAGLGAAAALTGAALMYKAPSGVKLFADDKLTGDDYNFMAYVSEYGKSYGTVAEFMFRKEQFVARHNEIEAFNADANNTHTVGHNLFSDKTYAEMKKLNGYKAGPLKATNAPTLDESNLAASVDWRSKNAVTPVKNQAQCGSCWAFSTTGAVEGADAIATGSLKSFSEQQLVSCSKQNSGCNGGLMDYAFQYIKTAPLELESNYPYTSGSGRVASCNYSKSRGVGTVSAFTDVQHTAGQMRAALGNGPVSVAIEADQMAFQSYTSGVITSGCGTNLDHGVLAVGYGTLDGEDFFLVKNSWGPSWGDQGYVRIGAKNQCGILNAASYPSA